MKVKVKRTKRAKQTPWEPEPDKALVSPPDKLTGSGSIMCFIKRRLAGEPLNREDDYTTLADEVAHRLVFLASIGKLEAIKLLLEKAESKQVTADEVNAEIERVFTVVKRHVKDKQILELIARDLTDTESEI